MPSSEGTLRITTILGLTGAAKRTELRLGTHAARTWVTEGAAAADRQRGAIFRQEVAAVGGNDCVLCEYERKERLEDTIERPNAERSICTCRNASDEVVTYAAS